MNFREHFEAWHLSQYRYPIKGRGTAFNFKYDGPTAQARWEAWQACANWCASKDFKEKQNG